MNFAGENLREWLASLSHNATDKAVNPVGLMTREKKKDIPETSGSIDYFPNRPGGRSETDQYNEYLDGKIRELGELDKDRWKKKEKEEEPSVPDDPVDPADPIDPVDPEDEKTDGRKFMEKLYKKQLDEGFNLEVAMKYNPATTPEDWARAFGRCRTTTSSDKHSSIPSDCYWPEEGGLEGSDFYKVGGGGRKSAPKGRTKKASRSGGGVGHGGG